MQARVGSTVGWLFGLMLGCGPPEGSRTDPGRPFTYVVDLTHTLDSAFPFIPVPGVTFPFTKDPIATLEEHGVAAFRWNLHEHIGTQFDAPSHFVPGGRSVEAIEADELVVPAAVIDISARAAADHDTELTVDDLQTWERRHGRIPERAAVFMYSGWDQRVKNAASFINADSSGTMHFPGISLDAAEFLLRERNITGVGVDVLSFDPGRDRAYRSHKAILGAGKWAVEAVANLNQIPPVGAWVFVGAVKVRGATGGPARIIAVW